MTHSQGRRLAAVLIGIVFATLIISGRLFVFQVVESSELSERARLVHEVQITAQPERGTIYDRNMAVLAGNSADYRIGASPSLVTQKEEAATALAPILGRPRYEILGLLESPLPYVALSDARFPLEVAEAVQALPYRGLQVDEVPRRIYPQGDLMCHLLGYSNFDGEGALGVEGYYQQELAGEAASASFHFSPLTEQRSVIAREGADLMLTVDRSVQYLVEEHLDNAIRDHGAVGGTIIVMDPRTGAIPAMASTPCFSPNNFYQEHPSRFQNPAVSLQYEPGSIMKLITMAAALDSGTVTPNSTYYDAGVIEVGGQPLYNWHRGGTGTTDMTTLLAQSLNVGAATLAVWMGPDVYYDYLLRFGFGQPTKVDLMSESLGIMSLPGDPLWTESNLGTNSFGQGISVTPLQMITAAAALANNGEMMQPYVVQSIQYHDGTVIEHEPSLLSRPVTPLTAQQVTTMAVNVVVRNVTEAAVDGYTVAGKSGTAQIPEGGVYHPTDIIGSFIGWLPADAPEIIILVKLDRPTSSPWGASTAAPTFAQLAEELVVLLNIPPDTVRFQEDIAQLRSE